MKGERHTPVLMGFGPEGDQKSLCRQVLVTQICFGPASRASNEWLDQTQAVPPCSRLSARITRCMLGDLPKEHCSSQDERKSRPVPRVTQVTTIYYLKSQKD